MMASKALHPVVEAHTFQGQDVVTARLPAGDAVTVALHGGHVLSWCAADRVERLFVSPRAVWDGHSAIRGGVPICFPQFNQRGPLAKHGFARNLRWTYAGHTLLANAAVDGAANDVTDDVTDGAGIVLTLRLQDDAHTRAWWPHGFALSLQVTLSSTQLRMQLVADNTGDSAWQFTGALHTYLQVADIAQVSLEGLSGAPCWDSLTDQRFTQAGSVRFDGEFDRVFTRTAGALTLHQPQRASLEIAQGGAWDTSVVWNPGAALSAQLTDMAPDSYASMLCVEAARIDTPVEMPPGARWTGWQQLTVLPQAAA